MNTSKAHDPSRWNALLAIRNLALRRPVAGFEPSFFGSEAVGKSALIAEIAASPQSKCVGRSKRDRLIAQRRLRDRDRDRAFWGHPDLARELLLAVFLAE